MPATTADNSEIKMEIHLPTEVHLPPTAHSKIVWSVGDDLVTISRDYYEPELSDMNLAADAAASDVIRLQWAFLVALLEIGHKYNGNHPGLLLMDEPQQQSVEEVDFFRMLDYVSKLRDSQITIGTSHEAAGISTFAAGDQRFICGSLATTI